MKNLELAKIFYEIADILEMQGVQWKPRAYRKAAQMIENLPVDIKEVYEGSGIKGLEEMPGVGRAISSKIEEFIKTGKVKEHEELVKSVPKGVEEMMNIPGMGPKKAWRLYQELGITSLKKLENYAKKRKISKLSGFGPTSEKDILKGLELVKKGQERILLGQALPIANNISHKLSKLNYVKGVSIAGSLRRKKETIGDIDILAVSNKPTKVMDYFTKMNNVKHIVAKGNTKSSVVLEEGVNCDLRVLNENQYGAALLYFTGSKYHNIAMRNIAIRKGMKLSEYGLFKGNKVVASKTEQEIYRKLGLNYIEPEMREDRGEMELSKNGNLPNLIPYGSLKGDLQMHTEWSDGENTTEEMIQAAIKIGYSYIAITDHSKSQVIANGLDVKRLEKQVEEIRKLNKKYPKIEVFAGSEVEIKSDGRLDYSNSVLKKLDFVVAAVHSGFKSDKDKMTKRVLKALDNKHVHMLAHPTGRLINKRDPFEIDIEKILQKAKENNVIMEINSSPRRLDLNSENIRKAIEIGTTLAINTDAHRAENLKFVDFGIAQARRGWAESKNIINTKPLSKLKKFMDK